MLLTSRSISAYQIEASEGGENGLDDFQVVPNSPRAKIGLNSTVRSRCPSVNKSFKAKCKKVVFYPTQPNRQAGNFQPGYISARRGRSFHVDDEHHP